MEHKCSEHQVLDSFDRAPVKGGGHTEFMLMGCPVCRKVIGFPKYNLGLITPEFEEEIKTKLSEDGWGELEIERQP